MQSISLANTLRTDGAGDYVPHDPDESAPDPRHPDVEISSYEELLEAARHIVEKEKIIWEPPSGAKHLRMGARPGAGYEMGEGDYDRVLLVVESNYDHRAYSAIADAIREKGAKVDTVTIEHSSGKIDPWEHELPGIHTGKPWGHPLLNMKGVRWWEDLAEADEEYDLLLYGVGGPNRTLEQTDYDRIPWRTEEDLVSAANRFPTPVMDLIDEKTTEIVLAADRFHLTDPEGTDLSFTNYDDGPEGGDRYYPCDIPGHIMAHPAYITEDADTTGVVAGTMNHAGAYPRIEVEVEDAKVVDVRGGGTYGERWRETMAESQDKYYPGLPGPGLFWLMEMAIGTNPKVARPFVENIDEIQFPEFDRRRSGTIHCGFGIQYGIEPYAAKQEDVPWGHVHVHLHFPTLEAEMPNGDTVTLIEDGHLTTLDDAEVREMAAKYGDPDELLEEDWIPAIPGINTEGDYNEDYASDPKSWLRKRIRNA
jgi:hypothetical protein